MSTRSTISVVNTDGTVSSIYCHFDGYLKNNGAILNTHYDELNKAIELVSHGDMSSLGVSVDDTQYYHRDRNESWERTKPAQFDNWDDFVYSFDEQDYNYVFIDTWYLLHGNSRSEWYKGLNVRPLSSYSNTVIAE